MFHRFMQGQLNSFPAGENPGDSVPGDSVPEGIVGVGSPPSLMSEHANRRETETDGCETNGCEMDCYEPAISLQTAQHEWDESPLQLLQTITLAVRTAPNLDAAIEAVVHQVCQYANWQMGEAWLPDGTGQVLINHSLRYGNAADQWIEDRPISISLITPSEMTLVGRVWKTRHVEWHPELLSEPKSCVWEFQAAATNGLRAVLAIPLCLDNHMLAVLVFLMNDVGKQTQSIVKLLTTIAPSLGTILRLKKTETGLIENQQQLTRLINSLPGIVFSATGDTAWSMTFLSQGCFRLTGYYSDELVGDRATTTYEALTHPDDLPNVLETIRHAVSAKHPYVVEYRIRTKSGDEKWLWEKGYGVFDANGQLLNLEGFITDITDRKQAEDALRSSEAQFRAVFHNAAIGIGATTKDGHIQESNRALQRMLGYTEEELKTLNFAEFTHPDDLALDIALFQDLVAGYRDHFELEKRYLCKNGQVCWVHLTVSAVRDAHGKFLFAFGLSEDISERKQTEEALRQAETKYRSIFENAVEGIFQTTVDGHYLTVNPMLARIYGYNSPSELMATLTDIQHQLYVDHDRRLEFIQLMRNQGAVWGFESQVYRQDGSIIWISECARALYNNQGELIGYEGTVEDITQRKHAELELHRRDALLRGVAEATNCLLTHSNVQLAIPEVLAILGRASGVDRVYLYENHPHPMTDEVSMSLRFEWTQASIESGIDKPYWQNLPYSAHGMMRWYALFNQGQSVGGIIREFPTVEREFLRADGILAILMVPVFVDSQLWGYIGFDECTIERPWSASEESILMAIAASIGVAIKRQHTEEQMRYQAFHDTLTGLPNRSLFNHRLLEAIDHASQTGELLAVLFLDLDRFKTINDTLGHAVGDQLLQQATARLTQCLRQEDTIARWGGDEFTLILPNLKSSNAAARIAQRIFTALKPSFHLNRHELHISGSIGIALYPYHGNDAQTLLKNADAALYAAKAQGRNHFRFYNTTINPQATKLLTLDHHLHQALERNEFVIHYQPQINIGTGTITQMEALVRWQHPQLGLIPPKTFISLAEENGMIVPIGEWVLRVACAQNVLWQTSGLPPIRIAVNLSARQFEQPNLVERIAQILQKTGLDPQFLELEITETAAMRDIDFTTKILRKLQTMGIRIALDDFGTGYSSLSYLKKFPLHTLKIDQSFVHDIAHDREDVAIITAMITLARGLNLSVVAEGVETQIQVERLQSLGCTEMQGYRFSRPVDVSTATELLRTYSPHSQSNS